MALEGKELEGKIGEMGGYFVDLHPNADLEVGLTAKVNLVVELKKVFAKTNTQWDDKFGDLLDAVFKKLEAMNNNKPPQVL